MADNVVANAGAGGATFATDERVADSVHFPITKLAWGALNTFTLVDTGGGGVPIQDGGNSITVDGEIALDAATLAALETIAVTGGLTDAELRATAVPVSLASVPSHAVTDGGGSLTVDGTVELGATALSALENIVVSGEVALDAASLAALETITVASVTAPLAAGDNNIGNVDVVSLPALAAGTNNIGDVDVASLPALPAGGNNIGDVDVLTLPATPTGTNSIGRVNPEPQTANGLTINRLISAATTNATSVKASAGQLYTVYAHNINAAVRYLKIYNKASAPTVGTDTPVLTLPIPGNAAGAGVVLDTGGMGIAFATGIAFALTTGVADADTAAVAASEIVVNLLYK